MKKRHPNSSIIERKLEQLPLADVDHLWNDMHAILDKKMPQKKERRRVIGWLASREGLLLLNIFFFISASTLFFLSTKQGSSVIRKNTPDPPVSNKSIKDDVAKLSRDAKESITTANESNQKTGNNESIRTPFTNSFDYVVSNTSVRRQPKKQSKKFITADQINQSTAAVADVKTNFDIAPVNLESIHHFLITSDHNKEKKFLSPQPEPAANKVKLNAGRNSEKGLYAGIISAVDMSSVHFQTAKPGATMGLMIGYSLNEKWSIESGLLWDTKRVYDNGSYFNPPGYTPTNGIKIIAVNGKSRLYEWPLNVKYSIIPGKHNLFATTGISSYLMRSENYDYEYTQNNQPGGHNYLSFTNETKDWFSVVNFSMGYTHKLGGNGSMRIEPYLKLPLKNIGTGNMPIMSTGLNIGFIKTLR